MENQLVKVNPSEFGITEETATSITKDEANKI